MKRDINELSLSDLLALHDALDRGFIDPISTKQLWWNYNNCSNEHQMENHKERIAEREDKLQRISDVMRDKASEYNY